MQQPTFKDLAASAYPTFKDLAASAYPHREQKTWMGPTELDHSIILYDHDALKSLDRLFARTLICRCKNWSTNLRGQTLTPIVSFNVFLINNRDCTVFLTVFSRVLLLL